MRRTYTLDDTNHIITTVDEQFAEPDDAVFDFPENFNFVEQQYFQIIDGELIEDIAKREADEEARREAEREATRMEAQVLYTALMTDTLIEEDMLDV